MSRAEMTDIWFVSCLPSVPTQNIALRCTVQKTITFYKHSEIRHILPSSSSSEFISQTYYLDIHVIAQTHDQKKLNDKKKKLNDKFNTRDQSKKLNLEQSRHAFQTYINICLADIVFLQIFVFRLTILRLYWTFSMSVVSFNYTITCGCKICL